MEIRKERDSSPCSWSLNFHIMVPGPLHGPIYQISSPLSCSVLQLLKPQVPMATLDPEYRRPVQYTGGTGVDLLFRANVPMHRTLDFSQPTEMPSLQSDVSFRKLLQEPQFVLMIPCQEQSKGPQTQVNKVILCLLQKQPPFVNQTSALDQHSVRSIRREANILLVDDSGQRAESLPIPYPDSCFRNLATQKIVSFIGLGHSHSTVFITDSSITIQPFYQAWYFRMQGTIIRVIMTGTWPHFCPLSAVT